MAVENFSLFPGVYTQVRDTSFTIQSLPTSIGFICFLSEKGPDNQLTLIGRPDELIDTFGKINVYRYGQGGKVAQNWLNYADALYCIRVLPDFTNTPCQNTAFSYTDGLGQHHYLAGEWSPGIEIIEASYANIALGVDGSGAVTFMKYGPMDYGVLAESPNAARTAIPTSATVGSRYYVNDVVGGSPTQVAWYGHEQSIATKTVTGWDFVPVSGVGRALVGSTPYVSHVYYTESAPLTSWEKLDENEDINITNTYVRVKNIADHPPTIMQNGDSYLITSIPVGVIAGSWVGHEGQVATWDSILNTWVFSSPDNVYIEAPYEMMMAPPVPTPPATVPNDFTCIVGAMATGAFVGKDGLFATYDSSKGAPTNVASWTFRQLMVNTMGTRVRTVYVFVSNEYHSYRYTTRTYPIKNTKWYSTNDPTQTDKALFYGYIHRTSELEAATQSSRPDLAESRNTTEPLFIFHAVGRGSYYNSYRMSLRLHPTSMLDIPGESVNDRDKTMILDIYQDAGSYTRILVETFEVSFNPQARDLSDNSIFVCDILNRYSNVLRCVSCSEEFLTGDHPYLETLHADIETLFTNWEHIYSGIASSWYPQLEYGTDGNLWRTNGSICWEVATSLLTRAYTGLLLNPTIKETDPMTAYETSVLDRENILMTLVFDAGYPKPVKVAIEQLIAARQNDCFGVLDMLDNATPKQALDARLTPTGVAKTFNSPYIALYDPYSEVYDAFTGKDIWISPVYHAARAYAITDRDFGLWYAPAGMVRGACPSINRLRYNLYRETSYQNPFVLNSINPIVQTRDGYYIWGQSTSYLKPSKLQDVNVVRLVQYIQRSLEYSLKYMLFELNDFETHRMVDSAVKGFLAGLFSRGALEGYSVRVYASEYDKLNHKLRVDVGIKPKMVIYQILLSITV